MIAPTLASAPFVTAREAKRSLDSRPETDEAVASGLRGQTYCGSSPPHSPASTCSHGEAYRTRPALPGGSLDEVG